LHKYQDVCEGTPAIATVQDEFFCEVLVTMQGVSQDSAYILGIGHWNREMGHFKLGIGYLLFLIGYSLFVT
jgi:hypothetical protein